MLALELAGGSRPDIVADVLLVDQQLVDGSARPFPAKIRANAAGIEVKGDLGFTLAIIDKAPIDFADDGDFLVWSPHKDHAIRGDALVLAAAEDAFYLTALVDQLAAKPEACGTALSIAERPPKASYVEELAKVLHCRPEDFDPRYADGENEIRVEGRVSAASHNAYATMNLVYGVDEQTIIELAPVLFSIVAARAVNLPREDDDWWNTIANEAQSRGLQHLQRFPSFQDHEGFLIDVQAAMANKCFGQPAENELEACPRNLFVEAIRRMAEDAGLDGSMDQFAPYDAGDVPTAFGFNPHVALFDFIAEGDAEIVRKLSRGDVRLYQSMTKAELNAKGDLEAKAEIIRKDLADQAANHRAKLAVRREQGLNRLETWRAFYQERFPDLAKEYGDLVAAYCKPEGWYPEYYSAVQREEDHANPFAETRFIDDDLLPRPDNAKRGKFWLSFNAPESRRLKELEIHRLRSKVAFREMGR
jgi:hypothetical protein